MVLHWIGIVGGCVTHSEEALDERIEEMGDHAADGLSAVAALERGDLAAVRLAGGRLARIDTVPGLSSSEQGSLDAMRAVGRVLSEVQDTDAAVATLAVVARRCGACHADSEVAPTAVPTTSRGQEAWMALALHDEGRWTDAIAPETDDPNDWSSRSGLLIRILTP